MKQPFALSIDDLDLRAAHGRHEWFRSRLAEHGVIVISHQRLDDHDFVEFLSGFGPLMFTPGETPVPAHPQLNVVTNAGRTDTPISNWHVDTGYIDHPPSYTALRAVHVPESGGATMFSNQYRALDELPSSLRERITGRSMTHVVTGVEPGPDSQTRAEHPLERPHPRTGRCALWLDAPARCGLISGLGREESTALAAELLDHSTHDANVWRHSWKTGDIVIWDNAVVLHRADHSSVVGDRTFHRGLVASTGYHDRASVQG